MGLAKARAHGSKMSAKSHLRFVSGGLQFALPRCLSSVHAGTYYSPLKRLWEGRVLRRESEVRPSSQSEPPWISVTSPKQKGIGGNNGGLLVPVCQWFDRICIGSTSVNRHCFNCLITEQYQVFWNDILKLPKLHQGRLAHLVMNGGWCWEVTRERPPRTHRPSFFLGDQPALGWTVMYRSLRRCGALLARFHFLRYERIIYRRGGRGEGSWVLRWGENIRGCFLLKISTSLGGGWLGRVERWQKIIKEILLPAE